jgi:uncharacterized membrane protein
MSKTTSFLSKEDEQEIVEAIRLAESKTSGEIRVHIENSSEIAHFDRAKIVFSELNMDQTELKNGVLIYLAVADKQFVICGDKGINELVGNDFWESTKNIMATHFKSGNFKQGFVDGIQKAGEQLQKHFPWIEGDTDELSNEISRG